MDNFQKINKLEWMFIQHQGCGKSYSSYHVQRKRTKDWKKSERKKSLQLYLRVRVCQKHLFIHYQYSQNFMSMVVNMHQKNKASTKINEGMYDLQIDIARCAKFVSLVPSFLIYVN